MANEIRVDVDISDFVRVMRATPRAIDRTVELTAEEEERNVSDASPRGRTGRLASSWSVERKGTRAFDVVAGVFYALWVSRGRGPVRHRTKRALEIGPGVVRASAGPVRPNPFIERSVDETTARVQMLALRAFREVGVG